MNDEKINTLRILLKVLETQIQTVARAGLAMEQDRVKKEYLDIYAGIEQALEDPKLMTFAPCISHWGTGGGNLWPERQVELLSSATKLYQYVKGQLESYVSKETSSNGRTVIPAKIFISHGHDSPALNATREFIQSLGLTPVIIGKQPSQGMSVDDKVLSYMKDCQGAIILATGDDQIQGESCLRPRQNVIHEIGLAQSVLHNRLIYLLEENTEFPSNIAPMVYERFTKNNLTFAFIAIVRDLKAFCII